MGSLSLFHRIFPTQGSNWRLLHCRQFFTIWATVLLQNPDSALGSDEDRKSVEPVSSCFFLPPTTLQLLSPADSPVEAPTHSKPGQTEASAQSPLASSWHFALLLGKFHLKIPSKPWVGRVMTWLEMFLLLQPISLANKPCSGDIDRKPHLLSSIPWRPLKFRKQYSFFCKTNKNNLRCPWKPNTSRILLAFKEHANFLKITLSETLILLS